MLTRGQFLSLYADALRESPNVEWAKDEAKLAKFMEGVRSTLEWTGSASWSHKGYICKQLWAKHGPLGQKCTLVNLRALPAKEQGQ